MHRGLWYFGITSLLLALVLLPVIGFVTTNTAAAGAPSNGVIITILNVLATLFNAPATGAIAPVALTATAIFIGFGELLFFVTGIVFTIVSWPRAGTRGK